MDAGGVENSFIYISCTHIYYIFFVFAVGRRDDVLLASGRRARRLINGRRRNLTVAVSGPRLRVFPDAHFNVRLTL